MCLTTLAKVAPQKNVWALKVAHSCPAASVTHTHTHTKTLAMMICTVHLFTRNKPTMRGAATLTCPKYCGSNTLRHPYLNGLFFFKGSLKQQGPRICTNGKGKF